MEITGNYTFMRKLSGSCLAFFMLALLLLISACGAPQPEEPAPGLTDSQGTSQKTTTTATASGLTGRVFAWEVKSDTSTTYLVGSIHVASTDIYPLDGVIEDAFSEADNLAVEVDISKVDAMSTGQLMMEYGTYPQGEGLKSNLPEDLYAELGEVFKDYGTDIMLIDMFRPWVISTLIEELQLEALGYSAQQGIDMYFIEKAVEDSKNIIELETAEYQIELLSSFPDEMMILVIVETLENPLTEEIMNDLFNAWENGDAAAIESLVYEDMDKYTEFEAYYDILYKERNYSMAEKIEGFLADDETYFIVVGAAHLVGEEGLINLLEVRGYEVTQLLRQEK
jgi:uncharacterized protein YbaP (TraB family)